MPQGDSAARYGSKQERQDIFLGVFHLILMFVRGNEGGVKTSQMCYAMLNIFADSVSLSRVTRNDLMIDA